MGHLGVGVTGITKKNTGLPAEFEFQIISGFVLYTYVQMATSPFFPNILTVNAPLAWFQSEDVEQSPLGVAR